jgi:hypothetical protein
MTLDKSADKQIPNEVSLYAEDLDVKCYLFTSVDEDWDEHEGCTLILSDGEDEVRIWATPWDMEELVRKIQKAVDDPPDAPWQ